MDLDAHIRKIPDFPKPGILFYDISTLLGHVEARHETLARMAQAVESYRPDVIAAIESRGFLFGLPLAEVLALPAVMIRKQGKLPGDVVAHSYDLEYGSDTIEISQDLVPPGSRVVIVDDLLATGGTAAATVDLLRKVGADPVGFVALIELEGLSGRDRLDIPVNALLAYP